MAVVVETTAGMIMVMMVMVGQVVIVVDLWLRRRGMGSSWW